MLYLRYTKIRKIYDFGEKRQSRKLWLEPIRFQLWSNDSSVSFQHEQKRYHLSHLQIAISSRAVLKTFAITSYYTYLTFALL